MGILVSSVMQAIVAVFCIIGFSCGASVAELEFGVLRMGLEWGVLVCRTSRAISLGSC